MGMPRGTGDAIRLVRGEMCRRLDALETRVSRYGGTGLRGEAEALVALAAEYGLATPQRLAEGLAVALGQGGRGVAVAPWIERLREALASAGEETGGADTWLASIMVRFAG